MHFVLFDVAVELGLPGGTLWLALTIAPLIVVWRRRALWRHSLWWLTLSAALVALTVIGCFDYYPWLLQPGRLLQWGAWGLWAAALPPPRLAEAVSGQPLAVSLSTHGLGSD